MRQLKQRKRGPSYTGPWKRREFCKWCSKDTRQEMNLSPIRKLPGRERYWWRCTRCEKLVDHPALKPRAAC